VLAYLIEIAGWAACAEAFLPRYRSAEPRLPRRSLLWCVGCLKAEGAQLMTGETVVSSGGMLMR
jgi:hypothetical protein